MEEIVNTDELYRRLVPFHVKSDGTVSSAAFKNQKKQPDPEPSLDLARLRSAEDCRRLAGVPHFAVGKLVAGTIRAEPISLDVVHSPTEDNDAHCHIDGEISKAKCSLLAEATSVVLPAPKREP